MGPCAQAPATSRHLTSPHLIAVDRRGVEPRFPACGASVVPFDQQPEGKGPPGARTRTASLPRRCAAPNTCGPGEVVPDGVEPSLPGCGPGVVPLDHGTRLKAPRCGYRSRTCHAEFMRLGRALAHPLQAEGKPTEPRSPRGESNSHARCGHEHLRLARLPFRHPALAACAETKSDPYGS